MLPWMARNDLFIVICNRTLNGGGTRDDSRYAIGEMQKGDVADVRIYKYRSLTGLLLIAYQVVQDEEMIKLLAVGSRENFYRDLKGE